MRTSQPTNAKPQPFPESPESGFTIIESLIAIIVVTILMVGLSPLIVLGVANRVQARRVEQASEAARAYIDGVRSGAIDHPGITSTKLDAVAAPTAASLSCSANAYNNSTTRQLYCIDVDGDGWSQNEPGDLVVQAFGYHPTSTDPDDGYAMGIRVYRADAFSTSGTLKKSSPTSRERANTVGRGLGEGKIAPLVELTTEIGTNSTTLDDLRDRLSP